MPELRRRRPSAQNDELDDDDYVSVEHDDLAQRAFYPDLSNVPLPPTTTPATLEHCAKSPSLSPSVSSVEAPALLFPSAPPAPPNHLVEDLTSSPPNQCKSSAKDQPAKTCVSAFTTSCSSLQEVATAYRAMAEQVVCTWICLCYVSPDFPRQILTGCFIIIAQWSSEIHFNEMYACYRCVRRHLPPDFSNDSGI